VRDDDLLHCYRLLELQPGATRAEVREAYRVLARVWHPDRFAGNPDLLQRATARQQELNDAYRRITKSLDAEQSTPRTAPVPPRREPGGPRGEPAPPRREPARPRAAHGPPPRHPPEQQQAAPGHRAGHNAESHTRHDDEPTPDGRTASSSSPSSHDAPSATRDWLRSRVRWLAESPLRVAAATAISATIILALALVVAGVVGGRDVLRTEDGATLRGSALAAGGGHGCVAAGARVACWGRNDFDQAGGSAGERPGWPGPVWRQALPDSVVALAAGLVHSCALLRDGRVHCWGGNFVGQLGDGAVHDRAAAAPVSLGGAVVALASLGRHTCVLTATGTAWCWGDDTQGQLGVGRPTAECGVDRMRFLCAPRPERVGAEGQWQALAVGGAHTCAIDRAGQLHCWGSNRYGQLGAAATETCRGIDGASPCRRRPAPVPALGDVAGGVRAVAAGASHTCVLDGAGRAWCWGLNTLGQAGTASGDVVDRPTPVDTELRFSRLVAGAYHTCGITAAGALHCWGSDAAGELRGRAGGRCIDGPCALRPVRLAGSGVADVAAGFGITCMRRRDGVMRCWGTGEEATGAEGAVARSRPAPPAWSAGWRQGCGGGSR
jgi:hypothetical protein